MTGSGMIVGTVFKGLCKQSIDPPSGIPVPKSELQPAPVPE